MTSMLSMKGIQKQFNSVTVLDDVDFEVESGEVHALLGANGAGKSTLIKVLGGQYPDALGTTLIDGRSADLSTPRNARLSGIGIVHQEFDLVPEMTVAENIFLGLEALDIGAPKSFLKRIDRRVLSRAAQQILDAYHLGLDPERRVSTLSPGAQKIAEIARVLALKSQVMIFDEPTARLGQRDKDALFAVFASLRRSGKKVVFVTHYLDEVMAVADRASIMRDGRMVARRRTITTSVKELSGLMVGGDVRRASKRAKAQREFKLLEVENLSDGATFEGVSLTIAAGEIVGLVGHLGSGRQEVTRCLIGSQRSTGRMTVTTPPKTPRIGMRFGFVPENRHSEGIFGDLSVATNIAIGLLRGRNMFSSLPRAEIERVARETISKLQIKTAGTRQKIGELSGGNQQKVVFGRSMVSDPTLYVIEAPTVGVDVKAAVELHTELFTLADRGAGILLATDDLDEAILLSDRILVMLRGKITADLNSHGLTRQELVAAMGAG